MEEERNQQGNPEETNHEEVKNEEVKDETSAGEQTRTEESQQTQNKGKAKKKKNTLKEIRDWVLSLAAALLVVFLVRSYVFTVIRVDGSSMSPTLEDGERLFVTVLDMKLNGAERGDIVICNYPGRYDTVLGIRKKQYFVKRVVAVGGDTVWRKNNATYVTYGDTGETVALDEEYASRYPGYDYEYQLQEDEYFVVGDNRGNSHDSRDWQDATPDRDVGPISKDMLVGHVRFVFWPLDEIGGVK